MRPTDAPRGRQHPEFVNRPPSTTLSMTFSPTAVRALPIVALFVACGGAEPEGPRVEGDPVGVVGAHEHGVARLALTVEGSEVFLSLDAPGDALFGFEREPRTADERALVVERVSRLQDDLASALALPSDLGCSAQGPVRVSGAPEVSIAGDTQHDSGDEAEHEEGHDHAEDEHAGEASHDHEEGEGDAHLEVTASVTFLCDVAPDGHESRLQLGPLLPGAEHVDLTVLTEYGDAAARVAVNASFAF